jgi:hypothetical protein
MSKGEVRIRKKIAKKLEGAAIKYSQNAELRAAMNLIPNIGSVIDVWISSKGQNLQQKRLLYTVSCLTDEMKKIKIEKIDKEFLDTEEFYDILRRTFENSIKT